VLVNCGQTAAQRLEGLRPNSLFTLIFVAPFTDFSKELAISTQTNNTSNAIVAGGKNCRRASQADFRDVRKFGRHQLPRYRYIYSLNHSQMSLLAGSGGWRSVYLSGLVVANFEVTFRFKGDDGPCS
jgi:hypothetical protein